MMTSCWTGKILKFGVVDGGCNQVSSSFSSPNAGEKDSPRGIVDLVESSGTEETILKADEMKHKGNPSEFGLRSPYIFSQQSPSCGSPFIVYEQIECDMHKVRYRAIGHNSKEPISIRQWAEVMSRKWSKNGHRNRCEFCSIIKNSPFEALFFETKGTTDKASYQEAFEFVLVDAPLLDQFVKEGGSDPHPFSEHFDHTGDSTVVAFDNIGGDARLIAPRPPEQQLEGSDKNNKSPPPRLSPNSYAHLASFCREAPVDQVLGLFQQVALEYLRRMEESGKHSVWLSTSGLGVTWLHFRLDSKPKYYTYPPFEMTVGSRDQ